MLERASLSMTSAPKLAAHGAEIPAIGFGTSGLGDVRAEHIATALQAGYRHIDTARKYGTERVVGEGMRGCGVPRADIFLCTKVSHEDLHAADFARSVDASLKALGVDPASPPMQLNKTHSVRTWRMSLRRPAPRAVRNAISARLVVARASSRLAMFTQAINRRQPTEASRIKRAGFTFLTR